MKHVVAGLALAAAIPSVRAETLYVSNERGNSISVIDAATMHPMASHWMALRCSPSPTPNTTK